MHLLCCYMCHFLRSLGNLSGATGININCECIKAEYLFCIYFLIQNHKSLLHNHHASARHISNSSPIAICLYFPAMVQFVSRKKNDIKNCISKTDYKKTHFTKKNPKLHNITFIYNTNRRVNHNASPE